MRTWNDYDIAAFSFCNFEDAQRNYLKILGQTNSPNIVLSRLEWRFQSFTLATSILPTH